jgi:hypothetical protein
MTSPSRIFHFDRMRPEHQEYFYQIPSILKSSDSRPRHGLQVVDMAVGDTTVFDTVLAQQNETGPIPIEQVKTIHIRESDPDYFWLTLSLKWQSDLVLNY